MNLVKLALLWLLMAMVVSCSKEDEPAGNNNNNNNNNNSNQVIELTQSFTIPANNHILPLADNHQSDILKVYKLGSKEFHFYHVFTNAQHLYHLARFENDTWLNHKSSPNAMIFAATDNAIAEVEHTSPNSLQDVINTRFFDPNTETFSTFSSQTFSIKFRAVTLAATQSDFYLIAKRQDDQIAMLYKWNATNSAWEVVIENIPDSEGWSPITQEAFRSKNNEFIYKNTNNSGVNFYEFKNNQFNRIYRGGYDEIILMRGARLHVINNNYVLVFDKVYNVGAGNTLSDYYTPEENYSILQSSVSGNRLILSLGTYSWSGTTSIQKIVVINFSTGKTYELPALVSYKDNDDWKMSNKYDADKWQFRLNNQNKLEGLVHFEYNGPFGQTKLYRVEYPVALD